MTATPVSPPLPVLIRSIDLDGPLPLIEGRRTDGPTYRSARLLVRLHNQPIGILQRDIPLGGLSPAVLAADISDALGAEAARHLSGDGLSPVAHVPPTGLTPPPSPPCSSDVEGGRRAAPSIDVVVATKNRPALVGRCLTALRRQSYQACSILLVDSSEGHETRSLVSRDFPTVTYIRNQDGGVCTAKNLGLRAAQSPFIALTDDDAVPDPSWLAELIGALHASPDAACVTGLAMPASLETQAQLWFEESGAFVEGFERRTISLRTRQPGSLLPFATNRIGAGVNMAWRTDVLRRLGYFDPALDRTGAEDLAAFYDALCAGYEIVYEPRALVYHEHRRTYEELRDQIDWHATGLGAYLLRCLVTQPRMLPIFLTSAPRGILYGFSSGSTRNRNKSQDFPAQLTRTEYFSLLRGGPIYLRSRYQARRGSQSKHARRSKPKWRIGARSHT